ncbi:MAG: radical SAM protein [Candidatus Aminicenantes bacterium]|nr:radical SAM protein [Candidatus Aminicenantes bacterium]
MEEGSFFSPNASETAEEKAVTDRKIILINPFPYYGRGINEATIYPPLGLAYLASALRKAGFPDIQIIDANILKIENKDLLRRLKAEKPDIVGIHLNVVLGRSGTVLGRRIRQELDCRICIGGPLVSSNPVQMLEASAADLAVIGEGETAFVEICQGKPLRDIKGLVYKEGTDIRFTPPRELVENLDEIPFPAYDLLPPLKLYKARARKKPIGPIITSRGCPYLCTYCNSSVFGKKFRARSPENVIQEIDLLVREYGIRELDVLDDNFTLDIKRADRILDLLLERKYRLAINLQNGVRADRLNQDLIKKMKRAGVFKVGIGIESGDKDMLSKIRKNLDLDKVTQAIRWFKEEGIITYGFFILGFPDETRESVERTIAFARQCGPTVADFNILLPFPGTAIYEELKQKKLLKEESRLFYDSGFYAPKVYHKCLHLTEEELYAYQKKAYRDFTFRIGKIWEILLSIRSVNELIWTFQAALPVLAMVLDWIE